ncbi:MAG: hypothetical protein HY556_05765 [Euryarchaeota archaeon]|nr:hypothetical protein [Euryarchaeota archaeon]
MKARSTFLAALAIGGIVLASGCISGPPVDTNPTSLPLGPTMVTQNVTFVSEIRGTVMGSNPLYFNPADGLADGLERHLVEGAEGVTYNNDKFDVTANANHVVITLNYQGQTVDNPVQPTSVPDLDLEIYDVEGNMVSDASSTSGAVPERFEKNIDSNMKPGAWTARVIGFLGANVDYVLEVKITKSEMVATRMPGW